MITLNQVTIYSPVQGLPPILHHIHCTFKPNTLTLIVGRTGSGKSTLLNAVAGLIPYHSGSILYDKDPLWNKNRMNDAVKFKIGMVFQHPEHQLFAESIYKEFQFSLRPYSLTKPEIRLRSLDALNQLNLPESILDESVLTLSDGIKRKVSLATTLATKPDWLLLDEPTAGIDPSSILPLLSVLRSHRHQANGGVIIASHDLDTFLPLADRVLILHRGRIEADLTPRELYANPGLLLQTHVGLPPTIQMAMALQEVGILVPDGPLTPSETAEAILEQIHNPAFTLPLAESSPLIPETRNDTAAEQQQPPEPNSDTKYAWIQQLHPIAKWAVYMLASIGILLQSNWVGIICAAGLTVFIFLMSGATNRTWLKPILPFAAFLLISCLVSGINPTFSPNSIHIESVHFSTDAALLTLQQLTKFLFIMILGIIFVLTTTISSMQLSLEQAFAWLERFRVPVSLFTFTASLILRFVPMLFKEIEYLSLITKARAKSHVKPGSIRLRDLHIFLIPLILAMMKNAENIAFALEARGYAIKRLDRASLKPLRLTRRDMLAIGFGAATLALFILVETYF
jgi:energy-coupling factor transporter ATP-binding protein EcfA2/energy-coupling factor transporter transmembrane protein EcfT